MKKLKKSLNEDEIMREKMKKCIHTSFGRLLHFIRTVSRLSLELLQEKSSINSGTIWRMEQLRNYSVLSYAQAVYYYLESIKCVIHIFNFCLLVTEVLLNGKSIVMITVDPDDLKDYNPKQILFEQQHADAEELERRAHQRKTILMKNRKFGMTKNKNNSNKKPTNKKKSKKR